MAELASDYVSLTFKYGDALRDLNSKLLGVEKAASKSGLAAGKLLTDGIARAKIDTSAMNKLAEQMGSNAGARIANGLRRTIGRERLPVPTVDPKLAGDVGGNLGAVIGQRLRSVLKREGDSAGQELAASLERGSKKSGETAGKGLLGGFAGVVGKGAIGAAGVAAGGIGYTLTKGFERLNAIDQAKAKLKGLGYEATQVEGVMTAATNAVKGTAFGLQDAATAATGALASGVKPGEELTKYLALTGDAATQANTDFDHMAQIMNKIQGQGKLTGETLQQLTENGLYAAPILADAFGVSQEELTKMVSRGEVSAEKFQEVLQNKIGGSALRAGETAEGAFKNMQAAIGRLGAKLAGPIFDQVPRVFNGITGAIDTAGQSIGPVMDRLGDTFGKVFGDKIVPLLDEVGPIAGDVFSKIGDTAKAAAPSLIEVGKGVGDFLGKAWDAVKSVLPTMGNMFKTVWESIRGIVVTVSPAVSKALKPIFSSLGNLTKALAPVARVLMTVLGGAFKGLAAVLGPVAKILLNVAGAVLPKVIDSVTWLVNKLTAVGPVFKTVFSAIGESAMWLWNNAIKPAWDGIVSVIKGAWSVLQVPFRLAKFAFEVLGAAATWLWQNAIVPAWDGIKAAVSAAWDFIQPVLEPFKTAFSAVGDAAMWLWNNAIVPAWDGIKAAFSSAWDFVSGIFDKLKTGFNTAKGVIVGVANAIGDGVKSAFSGLAAIIKAPLHALGSFLAGVPSSVLGVEIPYASTLQSWGKNLQGLAGGGLVRGPGSGTSDSVLAWLSNGEGVLTAKAMGKDGVPQLMSALNAGWVPSIGLLHSMLPGFKTGGMVGPDVQAAMGLTGTKYSQGVRNDCSGMVSRVINASLGAGDGSLMTTKNAAQWLTARGFVKGRGGPGTIRVGWYDHGPNPNDGHMAMTLSDGQNAESGGSVGSFTVGGAAAGADSPQFDQHMYLPNPYGEGPALGGVGGSLAQLGGASSGGSAGGSVTNPINKAAENFKDAAGQLADIGVGGLSESLLPDGFSNPMEWGALKAGATLLKFFGGLTKDPFAKGALNIAGSALSGSGSGVVDAISGMIPQPFGSLPAAQPNDFEGNVGGGGGSLASGAANMAAQFVPSSDSGGGDGWRGVQINNNGPMGANASDVANKINSSYNAVWRGSFGRAPGAP